MVSRMAASYAGLRLGSVSSPAAAMASISSGGRGMLPIGSVGMVIRRHELTLLYCGPPCSPQLSTHARPPPGLASQLGPTFAMPGDRAAQDPPDGMVMVMGTAIPL